MHIFLTGDIQVGKSTIIQKLIKEFKLSADGFITYWERSDSAGRILYLSPCGGTLPEVSRYILARDTSGVFERSRDISEIFGTEGVKALKHSGTCDVTVMDELGFLESDAAEFQRAVLERLSRERPVFGAVKPMHTEFLDAVREHPNVKLFEVTCENRDDLYISILKHIRCFRHLRSQVVLS